MKLRLLASIGWCFVTGLQLHAQGYIVPNGVTYAGLFLNGIGYGINVMHDPIHGYYTGFYFDPSGGNTYQYGAIVDVSVRVFLVSPGDSVSLQPILAGSCQELWLGNTYNFQSGVPFYVGLYTGNQSGYPPDGIYGDPLFGWAELVNNQGVIQLLGGALAYQAGGIYAGTQNLIPVPEPSALALVALGGLLLGWRLRKKPEL